MNRKCLFVISMLILVSFSVFAQDSDVLGWKNFTWGISNDDIPKQDSSVFKQPKRLDYKPLYADYSINNLVITKVAFNADFRCDNTDKLVSIVFRPSTLEDDSERTFDLIATALVNKYGQPSNKLEDQKTGNKEYSWFFKSTKISISWSANLKIFFPEHLIGFVLLYSQNNTDSNL